MRLKPLILALGLASSAGAGAGELPIEVTQALQQMQERLAKLEARNAELEHRLAATGPEAALETRVRQLESANAKLSEALASEHLSQNEPEIATRLKAVEFQTLGMQKQARIVESLEGITAGVSLTSVAQHANRGASATGSAENQINWRSDAQVSVPGGSIGDTEGKLFFHFRMGQGDGLASLNPSFSVPNATAFQLGGSQPDNASPILAQAWYQLTVPLPLDGVKDKRREHLELNFGKIDPFLFFDQNTAADDETARFMNLAFVHNPLLDAGGGAGLDAYGFTPGLRLAYHSDQDRPIGWGVSLGVFGSSSGAAFGNSLQQPFVIAQAETQQRFFGGLAGNYRVYAWRNGRATPFNNAVDTTSETQAGWGLSVDQQVSDDLGLWGRYGQSTRGRVQFGRAATLGAEFTGNLWGRGADRLGLAYGWLAASNAFKAKSARLDADGTGSPDFGWTASGAEHVAEVYYRWYLNKQFALTPDYQLIHHAGANGAVGDTHIVGLRAQFTY